MIFSKIKVPCTKVEVREPLPSFVWRPGPKIIRQAEKVAELFPTAGYVTENLVRQG